MPAALTRNLRLYPWYLASTYEGISNAVWYLYLFAYKGLSLGEMAWLVLLGDGVIVLAEVPTGWIADKLGRRLSVLVGIVLQALSALLFIFGTGFGHFWLALAVCGLGDTFRSGADQALLYDSCLTLKRRGSFRPLLAHSMFIATLVMVASQIAGGIIAVKISWELPFWLEVGFSAFGFGSVWLMREAPRHVPETDSPAAAVVHRASPGRGRAAMPGPAAIWLRLAPLAVFVTVLEAVPELTHFHLPAELSTAMGLTPLHLGFLFAAFELLQGLGNKLAGHPRLNEPSRVLPWIGGALFACFALFGARAWLGGSLVWLGLGLYLAARAGVDFLFGLADPLISEEANRRTTSAVRATALSVVNASRRLLPLGLLPLSAALAVGLSYPLMYAILLAALLPAVLLGAWWIRRGDPPA